MVFSWGVKGMFHISNEYLKAFSRSPKLWVGTLLVFILLFVAVFAPVLAPHDPNKIDVRNRFLLGCVSNTS